MFFFPWYIENYVEFFVSVYEVIHLRKYKHITITTVANKAHYKKKGYRICWNECYNICYISLWKRSNWSCWAKIWHKYANSNWKSLHRVNSQYTCTSLIDMMCHAESNTFWKPIFICSVIFFFYLWDWTIKRQYI